MLLVDLGLADLGLVEADVERPSREAREDVDGKLPARVVGGYLLDIAFVGAVLALVRRQERQRDVDREEDVDVDQDRAEQVMAVIHVVKRHDERFHCSGVHQQEDLQPVPVLFEPVVWVEQERDPLRVVGLLPDALLPVGLQLLVADHLAAEVRQLGVDGVVLLDEDTTHECLVVRLPPQLPHVQPPAIWAHLVEHLVLLGPVLLLVLRV